MKAKTPLVLGIVLGLAATAPAAEIDASKLPPPSARKDLTFAKDIKPMFEQSCVKCHGEEKPKGKLRLTTLEGVLKGGGDGKVVVPGDSAKSMLIHSVSLQGEQDLWMPPPKNKQKIGPLTKEQIGLVRAWIDQGAK